MAKYDIKYLINLLEYYKESNTRLPHNDKSLYFKFYGFHEDDGLYNIIYYRYQDSNGRIDLELERSNGGRVKYFPFLELKNGVALMRNQKNEILYQNDIILDGNNNHNMIKKAYYEIFGKEIGDKYKSYAQKMKFLDATK